MDVFFQIWVQLLVQRSVTGSDHLSTFECFASHVIFSHRKVRVNDALHISAKPGTSTEFFTLDSTNAAQFVKKDKFVHLRTTFRLQVRVSPQKITKLLGHCWDTGHFSFILVLRIGSVTTLVSRNHVTPQRDRRTAAFKSLWYVNQEHFSVEWGGRFLYGVSLFVQNNSPPTSIHFRAKYKWVSQSCRKVIAKRKCVFLKCVLFRPRGCSCHFLNPEDDEVHRNKSQLFFFKNISGRRDFSERFCCRPKCRTRLQSRSSFTNCARPITCTMRSNILWTNWCRRSCRSTSLASQGWSPNLVNLVAECRTRRRNTERCSWPERQVTSSVQESFEQFPKCLPWINLVCPSVYIERTGFSLCAKMVPVTQRLFETLWRDETFPFSQMLQSPRVYWRSIRLVLGK